MKRNDLIPALLILTFGAVIAIGSFILGLGSLRVPGPGMAPFLLGSLLIVSSLPVVIGSLRSVQVDSIGSTSNPWHGVNFKKISMCLATLLGFAVILEHVGFITSAFITMVCLFRIVEKQKWHKILLVAFLTVSFSYVLFIVILKVELPVKLLWIV